jgi:hypothetical protein
MSRFFPKFGNYIPSDVRGTRVDRSYVAHLQIAALVAVVGSATGIHAVVTGAAQELITEITNPGAPRNITATAGGTAGSIKAVQVVIEGTNYNDEAITETLPAFTVDTAGLVEGNKAFKTVTKITCPAHDAVSATVSIGFGEKLGLPYKLAHNTIRDTFLDNVKEATAPTVITSIPNLESNTIDLNSALKGKIIDIYLMV